MKIILFLVALGLFEPVPVEASDWVQQPSADNCKIYYSAELKTSKWLGVPDTNYSWDGDRLSWESQIIDEDGKKQTVKTYKQPIEIIADLKPESKVFGIEGNIQTAVSRTFGGPLKGFIWLEKVSGGGEVLLPFVADHIFIAKGDRLNPAIVEISDNPLESNYYKIFGGNTRVYVTGFSGMGGAAGAPPNLIAHYKMNESTASDNDELVTNGDFAAWDSVGARVEDPTDWTVIGESGDDPEISEAATGEAHVNTPTPGGGMCNIYDSGSHLTGIEQTISGYVVGRKYIFSITIDTIADGRLSITSVTNAMWTAKTIDATTTYTWAFVATHTSDVFRIHRKTGDSVDITIDDVSIKLCAIEDSSGNGNHGVAQQDSDAISVPGVIKTALEFNGSSDYIAIPDDDDFTSALTPFSISTWVNMDDATNFEIASKGVPGIDGEWRFRLASSDKIYFIITDESVGNCYIGRFCNTALTSYENSWIHFVCTYDGGILSAGIRLYLSSIRIDDADFENNVFVAAENLAHDVWIGRYSNSYANGTIDNVMFFAAELTQDEVNILYNNGAGTEIPAELDQMMSPRRANLSPFSLRRRYEY